MSELSGVPWPPQPIQGSRVALRVAAGRDRDAIRTLLTSDEVYRYLGGALSESDAHAATLGPFGQRPGAFAVTTRASDELIGTVGLDRRDAERPGHLADGHHTVEELELGFMLHPAFWGQGFATEAAELALGWAATHVSDEVVVACTQAANQPSQRLLDRLGFEVISSFSEFGADQLLLARAI